VKGAATWSGWSGCPCGRPAAGPEQGEPVVLAVPAVRQVQGQAAAAGAGDPGGDIDQVGADGGAAGLAVDSAGGSRLRVQAACHDAPFSGGGQRPMMSNDDDKRGDCSEGTVQLGIRGL